MNSTLDSTTLSPQSQPTGMDGRTLVNQCKGVLVVFARGMFSLLAQLQYEGVLICMAQACGEMLAEACWCDDVMHTIRMRKKITDALEHGIKQVPSMPPVGASQIPQGNGKETRQ